MEGTRAGFVTSIVALCLVGGCSGSDRFDGFPEECAEGPRVPCECDDRTASFKYCEDPEEGVRQYGPCDCDDLGVEGEGADEDAPNKGGEEGTDDAEEEPPSEAAMKPHLALRAKERRAVGEEALNVPPHAVKAGR